MDFEDFQFYRENFSVARYWIFSSVMGGILPTTAFSIALSWWRYRQYRDAWADGQKGHSDQDDLVLSKDKQNADDNETPELQTRTGPRLAPPILPDNDWDIQEGESHRQFTKYPRYTVSFTRSFWQAVSDLLKQGIERVVGCKLAWWPLCDPEDQLRSGHTRVYSMPYALLAPGKPSFYDDIPTWMAESLFPGLVCARQRAGASQPAPFNFEAVYLHKTTLMRLILDNKRSPSRQHQSSELSELPPPRGGPSVLGEERTPWGGNKACAYQDNMSQPGMERYKRTAGTVTTAGSRQHKDQPILFLTVDVKSNNSVACAVSLGKDDHTTFQNLRSAYRCLPGWGLKRATGIKFYRVIHLAPVFSFDTSIH